MNKAARLLAMLAVAGFCTVTAVHAADAPVKMDCKGDKKCDEQQKAATTKQ
ncbi:MAG: hypothetical protein H7838_04285 [Magnetococcus sp. DMHC-8]